MPFKASGSGIIMPHHVDRSTPKLSLTSHMVLSTIYHRPGMCPEALSSIGQSFPGFSKSAVRCSFPSACDLSHTSCFNWFQPNSGKWTCTSDQTILDTGNTARKSQVKVTIATVQQQENITEDWTAIMHGNTQYTQYINCFERKNDVITHFPAIFTF